MKKIPMEVLAQFIPECDIPLIYSAYCYDTDPIFDWDSEDLEDFDLYDSYVEVCDVSKKSISFKLRRIKPCEDCNDCIDYRNKGYKACKGCEDSVDDWVKICLDKCNLQWYLVEGEPEGLKRTQQIMKNHNSGNVLALREYQINRGTRSEKLAMVLLMRKSKTVTK